MRWWRGRGIWRIGAVGWLLVAVFTGEVAGQVTVPPATTQRSGFEIGPFANTALVNVYKSGLSGDPRAGRVLGLDDDNPTTEGVRVGLRAEVDYQYGLKRTYPDLDPTNCHLGGSQGWGAGVRVDTVVRTEGVAIEYVNLDMKWSPSTLALGDDAYRVGLLIDPTAEYYAREYDFYSGDSATLRKQGIAPNTAWQESFVLYHDLYTTARAFADREGITISDEDLISANYSAFTPAQIKKLLALVGDFADQTYTVTVTVSYIIAGDPERELHSTVTELEIPPCLGDKDDGSLEGSYLDKIPAIICHPLEKNCQGSLPDVLRSFVQPNSSNTGTTQAQPSGLPAAEAPQVCAPEPPLEPLVDFDVTVSVVVETTSEDGAEVTRDELTLSVPSCRSGRGADPTSVSNTDNPNTAGATLTTLNACHEDGKAKFQVSGVKQADVASSSVRVEVDPVRICEYCGTNVPGVTWKGHTGDLSLQGIDTDTLDAEGKQNVKATTNVEFETLGDIGAELDSCEPSLPSLGIRFREAYPDIVPGECRVLQDNTLVGPELHDALLRDGDPAAPFLQDLYASTQDFRGIVQANGIDGIRFLQGLKRDIRGAHTDHWGEMMAILEAILADEGPDTLPQAEAAMDGVLDDYKAAIEKILANKETEYEGITTKRRERYTSDLTQSASERAKDTIGRACNIPANARTDGGLLAALDGPVRSTYETMLDVRQEDFSTLVASLSNDLPVISRLVAQEIKPTLRSYYIQGDEQDIIDFLAGQQERSQAVFTAEFEKLFDFTAEDERYVNEVRIGSEGKLRDMLRLNTPQGRQRPVLSWEVALDAPKSSATACYLANTIYPSVQAVETTVCEEGAYGATIIQGAPFPVKARGQLDWNDARSGIKPPELTFLNEKAPETQTYEAEELGVICGGRPGDPYWADDCSCNCNDVVAGGGSLSTCPLKKITKHDVYGQCQSPTDHLDPNVSGS